MAENATRRAPAISAAPWLQPLPPATRLVLHGNARARALAVPVWGVAFAEEPCRAKVQGARATLWLGPDEYLLLDSVPSEPDADAAKALLGALAGTPHALVDISHR